MHLVVHTEYSLVDSVVRIPALVEAVRAHRMPAVAVTEAANFFSIIKFYRKAERVGVKPIVGADVRVVPERGRITASSSSAGTPKATASSPGSSRGPTWRRKERSPFTGSTRRDRRTHRDLRVPRRRGGTGLRPRGAGARAPPRGRMALPLRGPLLPWPRTARPRGEEALLDDTVRLAAEHGVPVVATNDVRFLAPREFEAHEARVCIQEGWILGDPDRPRRYTEEQYLRSADEMRDRFADVSEAIENTLEIARRCSLELELGKDMPPEFPVEPGETAEGRLAGSARAGLDRRFGERAEAPEYRERLEYEIAMVTELGFSGYYLIVADSSPGHARTGSRSAPDAAPGRGRSPRGRSASPTSIQSPMTSSSNAFSILNGFRCPTSTSTSAWRGATGSSTT